MATPLVFAGSKRLAAVAKIQHNYIVYPDPPPGIFFHVPTSSEPSAKKNPHLPGANRIYGWGSKNHCRFGVDSSYLDWLPGANRWPVLLPTATASNGCML